MSNANRPAGYRPVRHLNGSAFNGQTTLYWIPAADAVPMAVGDLVDLGGSADANGVPSIVRASAVNGPFLGAIVGFLPSGTFPVDGRLGVGTADLSLSGFRPASTERYALVADAQDVVYQVQGSGTFVLADTGLNASTTVTAATANGNAGMSNMQLDLATKAVTATLGFKILGALRSPDHDPLGANVKLEVVINQHRFGNAVAGV